MLDNQHSKNETPNISNFKKISFRSISKAFYSSRFANIHTFNHSSKAKSQEKSLSSTDIFLTPAIGLTKAVPHQHRNMENVHHNHKQANQSSTLLEHSIALLQGTKELKKSMNDIPLHQMLMDYKQVAEKSEKQKRKRSTRIHTKLNKFSGVSGNKTNPKQFSPRREIFQIINNEINWKNKTSYMSVQSQHEHELETNKPKHTNWRVNHNVQRITLSPKKNKTHTSYHQDASLNDSKIIGRLTHFQKEIALIRRGKMQSNFILHPSQIVKKQTHHKMVTEEKRQYNNKQKKLKPQKKDEGKMKNKFKQIYDGAVKGWDPDLFEDNLLDLSHFSHQQS